MDTTKAIIYEETQPIFTVNELPNVCLGCNRPIIEGYNYCEACDPGLADEAGEVRSAL